MDFNQLGTAVYEILNWLPYSNIIRFCLIDKKFSLILENEYFYSQYLLKNYDIEQPIKSENCRDTMKVTYETLKGMKTKGIVVSKSLLSEIISNSTITELKEFNIHLASIGEPGFLDIFYHYTYIKPASIFNRINTPGNTQYADQYDMEINEIDQSEMSENRLKAKLFKLVDKYVTRPTEYIVDISVTKTVPYDRDFLPYIYNEKFDRLLMDIQKRYEYHDIYYYRYF